MLGLLAGSIAVESFQKRVIATSAELLGLPIRIAIPMPRFAARIGYPEIKRTSGMGKVRSTRIIREAGLLVRSPLGPTASLS